jgi:hypothetical protein
MIKVFSRLGTAMRNLATLHRRLEEIKINQGLILGELLRQKQSHSLLDFEFKVFSQWGEDGIIQYLIGKLSIVNRTFIEFGVEDFFEANCRYLLMKDYWQGFVVDGSAANIARLKSSYLFWKYPLQAKASFITRENIELLLEQSGFDKDLGVLSIDIDGVDYYVLERLGAWRPRILIVEYNGVFGHRRAVSVPYTPDFRRSLQHSSNLYYGASLRAFNHLASARNYALVGVNSAGSNAFFVRRDLLNGHVREVSVDECYRDSSFREGRDAAGRLSCSSGADRRKAIADLPLVDVVTGERLKVGDLAD